MEIPSAFTLFYSAYFSTGIKVYYQNIYVKKPFSFKHDFFSSQIFMNSTTLNI